jgi:phosphopantothenoylcysteine decarboxylase/phosphopantothenate--cysteine ligase
MPSPLENKRVLLGVSGSIAAYKSVVLVRLLIKAGASVQVIMTSAASAFVAPLTFSTLSKRPVFSDLSSESGWNNHVELALWADAMLVAPATANTLAKMAHGVCDNMLTACYLSGRCPVFLAPAMDVDMWNHAATQRNVQRLQEDGNFLIPVGHGELASGLSGPGRMAEPEDILGFLEAYFRSSRPPLSGKRILVTAGPTYEPIDPVRFIGNRSSGKMGLAIAHAAMMQGAAVELVLGPSALVPDPKIRVSRVESAREMHAAAMALFPACDAAILNAAVADFRPKEIAGRKIKKDEGNLQLELVKNPDIAADLGKIKRPDQRIIGFALETHNAEAHALDKMYRKNFDCIVLNALTEPGAGFLLDTNKISVFFPDNKRRDFELKSKASVGQDIIDILLSILPPA